MLIFILSLYSVLNLFANEIAFSAKQWSSPVIGSRGFIIVSTPTTSQYSRSFMETCDLTLIGTPFSMTSPGGLVNRNGSVFTWNRNAPFQLWKIDTVNGVHNFIFNLTGVPLSNLTGLCWDGSTMYGVATNLSSSQIFTVNMSTGSCTPLGSSSAVCAGAVNLFGRLFSGSSLYSVDMVNDNIYRWNKPTGIPVLFGEAGFNAEMGNGAAYDSVDFYLTSTNQLRKWDTTGFSTVVCTYSSNITGIACLPKAPVPFLPEICMNGLNIPIESEQTIRDTIKHIGNNFCSLTDVNVKLDTITHTWVSLMAISLRHNTSSVNLITHRGGSGDNIFNCALNDSAANPVSSGIAPFTGSWRPEQPLNTFNTQSPQGNWVLSIYNLGTGDTGTLKAWCITLYYSCPIGGIQTVEIPFTYRLYQNFPNPFNPVTTIKYGLPGYSLTSLTIYDALGRVIAKPVDSELKDAGTYEAQWDASDYSSGIYFYTLESGSYIETKKLMLLK